MNWDLGLLYYKFGIVARLHQRNGKPVIYITSKSMVLVRTLVKAYILPEFIYKIKARNRKAETELKSSNKGRSDLVLTLFQLMVSW